MYKICTLVLQIWGTITLYAKISWLQKGGSKCFCEGRAQKLLQNSLLHPPKPSLWQPLGVPCTLSPATLGPSKVTSSCLYFSWWYFLRRNLWKSILWNSSTLKPSGLENREPESSTALPWIITTVLKEWKSFEKYFSNFISQKL